MNEFVAAGTDLLTWMDAHAAVAPLLILAMFIPAGVSWWLTRRTLAASRDGVHQIEHRLSHLCSAVEMLTDTTESGLQTAFAEIQRVAAAAPAVTPKRAGIQTRVRRAARGGRTPREIAQHDGVSEGAVRLRLTLAGTPTPAVQAAVQ